MRINYLECDQSQEIERERRKRGKTQERSNGWELLDEISSHCRQRDFIAI